MAPPLPANETARLAALARYAVLDTPAEAEFDDLVGLAAQICGVPIALISLIDAERQWFKARLGLAAPETPREVAFCAYAITQPTELFIVPDAHADERFATNPLVTADPHIRFYAGIPLQTSEGYGLGTLCVIDRVPRELTPDQQNALRVLGRQVMAQLELRRQVAELRQAEVGLQHQATHLRALYQVGQAISARTAVFDICQAAHQALAKLMSVDAFFVSLIDEARDESYDVYLFDDGQLWPNTRATLRADGIIAQVLNLGQPLWLDNFESVTALSDDKFGSTRGSESILAAPLQVGQRLIGVLSAQSYTPQAYTPDHLQLLTTLASQVAIAVENARSYAQMQTEVIERRQAERESALLAQLGQHLSAATTPREAARIVVNTADELLGWEACAVNLRASDSDHVLTVLSIDTVQGERVEFQEETYHPPSAMTQKVMNEGGQLILRDQPQFSDDANAFGATSQPSASLLFVPLRTSARVVGVMTIQSYTPRAYTADSLSLLQTLADQVANVLERLRFEAELREQKDLFENLVAIARATAAGPSLEATLHNTLGVAARITAATSGSLFLLDDAGRVTHGLFARGNLRSVQRKELLGEVMSKGLAGWVYRERQSVLITDTEHDERWVTLPDQPYVTRSVLSVPLLTEQQFLGVLMLLHTVPNHFTETHRLLLQGAADQMRLALVNARTFELQKQMAERQAVLYGILTTVGGQLNPQEVAEAAVEVISTMLDWPHVGFLLPDGAQTNWTVRAASGLLTADIGFAFPINDGLAGQAFQTRRVQYAAHVETNLHHMAGQASIKSELVAPLQQAGEVLGAFVVASDQADAFTPDERALIESLAGSLSLALNNARLTQALNDARMQLDDLLHRFLPASVADHAMANPDTVTLGGERREISVLFADIRGYTSIAETLEPEAVMDLLNQQFTMFGKLVLEYGGVVPHFAGDMIMAIFNALGDQPDHAWRAAHVGVSIQAILRRERQAADTGALTHQLFEVQFGVGINTGPAIMGYLGFEERLDFTAIGDTVNVASRLCAKADGGQVLLSPQTYVALQNRIRARALGAMTLKGRAEPLMVYEALEIDV